MSQFTDLLQMWQEAKTPEELEEVAGVVRKWSPKYIGLFVLRLAKIDEWEAEQFCKLMGGGKNGNFRTHA